MPVEKCKQQGRFLLLYGSATGQAKAIAEEIAEKAPSFGLTADLFECDDIGKKFNIEKEKCVVIIASTTGDGDPAPNAEKFMRRIKKRILSSTYLAHLHYALLGLGDSNYSNFCRCARDIDARLEAVGAQKLYAPGFADDGVGLEIVADPWLKDLYPALQNFLDVHPSNQEPVTETVSSISHSETNGKVVGLENATEGLKKLTVSPSGNKEKGDGDAPSKKSLGSVIHNGDSQTSDKVKTAKADTIQDSGKEKLVNGSEHSTTLDNTAEQKSPQENHSQEASSDSSITVSEEKISSNKTVNVSEEAKATRASNRQACCSSGGFEWPETPCAMADIDGQASTLVTANPVLGQRDLTVPVLPPAYLDVSFCDAHAQLTSLPYQNNCKLPCAASDVFNVSISKAQVLTAPDAVKKTLLLRLSLEGTDIKYSPGDSLSIVCPNSFSEVDLLIQRLQLEDIADQVMTLTVKPDTKKRRAAVPAHIHPSKSTLRHVLSTCVSIRDPPTKAFIRALVEYTRDESEVRRMQELCSKEGAQDYTNCLRQAHVTLLDFLYAFPSCLPPAETILEHLPRLQPRPYSACSCQEVTPGSLDFVFNLVEIAANPAEGRYYHRRGVCTGWLDDITGCLQRDEQDVKTIKIPVFVRTNQHFRPPSDLSQPLIMIGPGTGVAPFIGFLEGRKIAGEQLGEGSRNYGETWLYFGCRNEKKDFLFRDKLANFEKDGTLTQLQVTFSRDNGDVQNATSSISTMASEDDKDDRPPDSNSCSDSSESSSPPPPTRYVQDQMRREAADVARLLTESDALVYVCGDAKNMAADVAAAFEDILRQEKGMSQDDAHMFVMKKRIHKTYLEDVWL